jgi:hypothetical protein
MRKKAPALPSTILRDNARSPLFWLLYEHHDALTETWRHRRANWLAVCTWAAEERIADQDGKLIKADAARADAARKTWERVCAVKAQEKARQEAKPRPVHLRSPAVNQPPAVAVAVVNPPNRSHPPPAQDSPGEEFDVEQHMADIRATIAHRSGRS